MADMEKMRNQTGNITDKNRELHHKTKTEADIAERIKRQEHGRRRKASIRRQKARRRNVCIALVIILVILIFIITKISSCVSEHINNKPETQTEISEKNEKESSKENETSEKKKVTYKIEAPRKRNKSEVYKALKKYAEDDEKMARLYGDRKLYKPSLLNKVINNPEMTDFILGYNNAPDAVTGGLTDEEINKDFPLLLQWDKRWAYKKYGDSNIGLAGCGPTCLSMVIFSLTRDENATPDVIAEYSENNGHYVDGIGTAWALMTDVPGQYGVSSKEISISEETFKSELDEEKMLICGVGPGDFTTGGHFIVIYGYDEEGFLVNDPYCMARSQKKWSYERLSGQLKVAWSYDY